MPVLSINIVTVMKYCFHHELSDHMYFILCVVTDTFQVVIVNGDS